MNLMKHRCAEGALQNHLLAIDHGDEIEPLRLGQYEESACHFDVALHDFH